MFFGRDRVIEEVAERLSQHLETPGVLVVSGVSGAGKSSLLNAGVLPRLARQGLPGSADAASWPCLLFTPGSAPLQELAVQVSSLGLADPRATERALRAGPGEFALTARQALLSRRDHLASPQEGRLLLVVDQFEQLFTLCSDTQQRQAFITALHSAATVPVGADRAPPALVVVGVRADFEGRCAEYPELVSAIQDRYLLTAMTGRELGQAITGPAAAAGSSVDPALTEALLLEVATRKAAGAAPTAGPGMLPLLSHALDQAWRGRAGDVLTLADYERTGGIASAVARTAQDAYETLAPALRPVARQVFTMLAAASPDGTDTAVPLSTASLQRSVDGARGSDVDAVLKTFAAPNRRLLTIDAETVEITHEVLLTAWPLLRDSWLAETRTDRTLRTGLHASAAEWTSHDRDPAYLYAGSLLEAAMAAEKRTGTGLAGYPPLDPDEQAFLAASRRARARRVRRVQGLIAVLSALAVALAATTVLAIGQRNAANSERNQSISERNIAESRQVAAESSTLLPTSPGLASALAVEAYRISPTSDAVSSIYSAAALPLARKLPDAGNGVNSVAFSPGGQVLAIASNDRRVRLWQPDTGRLLGELTDGNPINSVAFSPDGQTIATGDDDGTAYLWDVASRRIRATLHGDPHSTLSVQAVAFSPGGAIVATGGYVVTGESNAGIRLWDAATGKAAGVLRTHPCNVTSLAFTPDSKTLATGCDNGTVSLWNMTDGKLQTVLKSHTGAIWGLAFSPDGSTVAAATDSGTAQLWDITTGAATASLKGEETLMQSVAFSPDGKVLATGSGNGTVRLWDISTGRILQTLANTSSDASALAFSPDGQTLAAGSELWGITNITPQRTLTDPRALVYAVAFSPSGHVIAASDESGYVMLWRTAAGKLEASLEDPGGTVSTLAFSPDGQTLAIGDATGDVHLWDLNSGSAVATLVINKEKERFFPGIIPIPIPSLDSVSSVAFSPSGRVLAVGSEDGSVELWDVATRSRLTTLAGSGGGASVAFSPDGSLLASGGDSVRIWDVDTGKLKATLSGAAASIAFSPDGTLIAGAVGSSVRVWNVSSDVLEESLTGQDGTVTSVAFSPNGRTLASGSSDTTVRLFDVATGDTRQILGDQVAGVTSVAYSPDGSLLVTGNDDQAIRLWSATLPDLAQTITGLCATADTLTPQERAEYLPAETTEPACPTGS